MAKYIGIDLGTTYTQASLCRTSAWNNDEPETEMLRFPESKERLRFPSMVFYPGPDEKPLAGEKAEEQLEYNPKQVLRESKSRLISEELLEMIVDYGNNKHAVHAYDVSSTVLMQAIDALNDRNNERVDWAQIAGCTITYPASFPYNAIKYTRQAAECVPPLKTFNDQEPRKLWFLPEPIAAFIGVIYGHDQVEFIEGETILVVDIGAGTTDTTIIQVKEVSNGRPNVEIIEVGEHILQGGNDYDKTVAEYLCRALWPEILDPSSVARCERSEYKLSLQRFWYSLILIAREIKETLAAEDNFEEVYDIRDSQFYKERYFSKIVELLNITNRTELILRSKDLNQALLTKINHPVGNTLRAGLQRLEERYRHGQNRKLNLSKIILAGGGSQVRAVHETLLARYGLPPIKPTNPHHLIAQGAAIYCSMSPENKENWKWPVNKDVYLIVQDQNRRNTWEKIWGREQPEGEYDYSIPSETRSVAITVGAGFFNAKENIDRITDQESSEIEFSRVVQKNEKVRIRTWVDHDDETPYMQLLLLEQSQWKSEGRPIKLEFHI